MYFFFNSSHFEWKRNVKFFLGVLSDRPRTEEKVAIFVRNRFILFNFLLTAVPYSKKKSNRLQIIFINNLVKKKSILTASFGYFPWHLNHKKIVNDQGI